MEQELGMDRGWKDAESEKEMAGPLAVNINEEEWGAFAAFWTCYWPHTHTHTHTHTNFHTNFHLSMYSSIFDTQIYEANK